MATTPTEAGRAAARTGKPGTVAIEVDGRPLEANEGHSVLAALWSSGTRTLHRTARTSEPRGFLCGIGVCFECLVVVDGVRSTRACMVPVADGMKVETQDDAGLRSRPVG
ncbi:MAG TPA: (2Fe-2S)-binding protein [Gaiellaceae bacterium]|jgi:predicted molibdopterin-dependent oxidoreductase YjgC